MFISGNIIEKIQRTRRSALDLIISTSHPTLLKEDRGDLKHLLFVIRTGIIRVVLKDMGEPLGNAPVRKDLLFDSLVSNNRKRRKPARRWSKVGTTYPHGLVALV